MGADLVRSHRFFKRFILVGLMLCLCFIEADAVC